MAFEPPKPPSETQAKKDKLVLDQPPASWGLPIKGSSGQIYYKKENQKEFVISVDLRGLVRNHRYVLTLNGKPWHPSNEKLPERYGQEGYYDFAMVPTDSIGNVKIDVTLIDLPPGDYNVKFFVKDPANDWKIVLYNDFLIFSIR